MGFESPIYSPERDDKSFDVGDESMSPPRESSINGEGTTDIADENNADISCDQEEDEDGQIDEGSAHSSLEEELRQERVEYGSEIDRDLVNIRTTQEFMNYNVPEKLTFAGTLPVAYE